MGAFCAYFFWMGAQASIFFLGGIIMNQKVRRLAHGAVLAAMYAALCHLQNLLLPGSATWAIQFRAAEALCVLALFTPSATLGLTVGCLLFNLTYGAALPLDPLVGSAATAAACALMRLLRKFPYLALSFPALTNALLVGWELTVYIGNGFPLNALYVALGELAVLYTLGTVLYTVMKKRGLGSRLFGETNN